MAACSDPVGTGVDDEGDVQGFGGSLLGVFSPTVIPGRRVHIRMAHELLDDGNVDPGVKEVRNTGPT